MNVRPLSRTRQTPVVVVAARPATRVAKAVLVAGQRVVPGVKDSHGSRKKKAGVNDAAAVEKKVS
jgi:hypothetical protein